MDANKSHCFLVSFSPFEDDSSICLVGNKAPGKDIEIVNAFDDQEKVKAIYDVWPNDLK